MAIKNSPKAVGSSSDNPHSKVPHAIPLIRRIMMNFLGSVDPRDDGLDVYMLDIDDVLSPSTLLQNLTLQRVVGADLISIFCSWKMFCARYLQNWCTSNGPCGLLIEPITGSVGLVRTNLVSLFRCPEDIERLLHGSSTELGDLTSFGVMTSLYVKLLLTYSDV